MLTEKWYLVQILYMNQNKMSKQSFIIDDQLKIDY